MIRNLTTGRYLSGYPETAVMPWTRLRGMIGRRFVCGKFDALIFRHCSAVHSCWMRFPLDLVFVDSSGVVVHTVERFMPWRTASGGKTACTVVELPPGAIAFSGTGKGDRLDFDAGSRSIEKLRREDVFLSDL